VERERKRIRDLGDELKWVFLWMCCCGGRSLKVARLLLGWSWRKKVNAGCANGQEHALSCFCVLLCASFEHVLMREGVQALLPL